MFLLRIDAALREHNVAYAIVGGHAVSLHGAVRGTLDVDIMISAREQQYVAVEMPLRSINLSSRVPLPPRQIFCERESLAKQKNPVARSFINLDNPAELVDVLVAEDLDQCKVCQMRVASVALPVIALDELIAMKRRIGRPQDLADVDALERLQ